MEIGTVWISKLYKTIKFTIDFFELYDVYEKSAELFTCYFLLSTSVADGKIGFIGIDENNEICHFILSEFTGFGG